MWCRWACSHPRHPWLFSKCLFSGYLIMTLLQRNPRSTEEGRILREKEGGCMKFPQPMFSPCQDAKTWWSSWKKKPVLVEAIFQTYYYSVPLVSAQQIHFYFHGLIFRRGKSKGRLFAFVGGEKRCSFQFSLRGREEEVEIALACGKRRGGNDCIGRKQDRNIFERKKVQNWNMRLLKRSI